jgi:hypothetical protein
MACPTSARPRRLCRARRARQDRRPARRRAVGPADRDRRPSRRRQIARRGGARRDRDARDRRAPARAPAGDPVSLYSKRPAIDWIDKAGKSGDESGSVRVTSTPRARWPSAVRRRAQVARRGPRRSEEGRAAARAASRFARGCRSIPNRRGRISRAPKWSPNAARLRPAPRRRAHRADGPSRPSRDQVPTPSRARTRSTMARSTMPPASRRCSRRRGLRRLGQAAAPLGDVHRQHRRGAGPARRRLFRRPPDRSGGEIVGLVDLDMPLLLYPFTDVIAFGADHSTVGQGGRRGRARRWASPSRPTRCRRNRSSSAPTIIASSPAACRRSC